MIIVQLLITAATRQAGKVLNTAFGWATTLLFGKVPADRQIYLSLISFSSVIWLILVAGIAFPSFATFMLAFVTVPSWVRAEWIRLGMLAGALLLPLLVGALSLKLDVKEPSGAQESTVKRVLRGYPATLGLALTLIMLTTLAPLLKLREIVHRWTTAHVPIIVETGEYPRVLEQVQGTLDRNGVATQRRRASWMIRTPTKVMTFLAGGTVGSFVADELTTLVTNDLEILLHPADLVITGQQRQVDSTRALLAERLMFLDANLTWTKSANEIEDRLVALWRSIDAAGPEFTVTIAPLRLKEIDHDVRTAHLTYEEWEILNRGVTAVDRALLAVDAGAIEHPRELFEGEEPLGSIRLRLEHRAA